MTTLPKSRPAASGLLPGPASPPTPPKAAPAAGRKPGLAGTTGSPLPPAGPGTHLDVPGVSLSPLGDAWADWAWAGTPGEGELAHARSWTLELPAGLKVLSLNSRLHWAEKGRRARELKKAAWAVAISRRVPQLDRISVIVEYQPPDKRHRDADNVGPPSGKYAIDGLVAAKVIPDDESPRYVADIQYEIGPVYPHGRLVLHVTEVPQ